MPFKVDDSGINQSYYERYREGLETMLAAIQRPALAEAQHIIQEGIQKDDENFDLYHDWQKAVAALQTLMVRDSSVPLK